MKVEIKIWWIVLFVALIWAAVSVITHRVGVRYHSEVESLSTHLYRTQDSLRTFKIIVSGLEEYVFQSDLMVIEKDDAIFSLKDELERLRELDIKRVNVIGRLSLQIKALRDSLVSMDTIIIVQDCEDEIGNFIKLPLSYSWEDRWARAYSSVDLEGRGTVGFNVKEVPLNIVLGNKKQGLIRSTPVVMVTTLNPYVTVDTSNFVLVDNRKTEWRYVGYGAGGATALILLLSFLLQ